MTEAISRTNLLAALRREMPVAAAPFEIGGRPVGLVIVDEVNGFATVGAGALAPQAPNAQVARMVAETDRLARDFADAGRPIAVFLDSHQSGKPEPPYPPHCEIGSVSSATLIFTAAMISCRSAGVRRPF